MPVDLLISAIEGAVAAVVVWLMFKWARRAQKADGHVDAGATVLTWGIVLRSVVAVSVLGLGAFVIGSRRGGAPAWVQGFFLFLFLISLASAAEMFFTSYRCLPTELQRCSVWRRKASLPWQDIDTVEWRENSQWFYIRTAGGVTAYVPAMMNGIRVVAEQILALVPQRAYGADTQEKLEQLRGR